MYNARYKNGNAIPSLLPDSADNKFRKCPGTRLANFPFPTTDDARTGSVAVTHAPTHNASTYSKPTLGQGEYTKLSAGISQYIKAELTIHPNVMTGTSNRNRLFQCRHMYAFGNSTPTANTCTIRTIRDNSSVIWSVFPHVNGLNKFSATGPNIIPTTVATAIHPQCQYPDSPNEKKRGG